MTLCKNIKNVKDLNIMDYDVNKFQQLPQLQYFIHEQ